MAILLLWLTLLLSPGSNHSAERTEILRTVLRATVRDGYPWSRPHPTVVSIKTSDSCDARQCPSTPFVPGDTLPLVLQTFVNDSLDSRVGTSLETACHIGADLTLLILAEPRVQGDTAYVGVSWRACVPHPLKGHDTSNAHAIIELVRSRGAWTVGRLALQTIS